MQPATGASSPCRRRPGRGPGPCRGSCSAQWCGLCRPLQVRHSDWGRRWLLVRNICCGSRQGVAGVGRAAGAVVGWVVGRVGHVGGEEGCVYTCCKLPLCCLYAWCMHVSHKMCFVHKAACALVLHTLYNFLRTCVLAFCIIYAAAACAFYMTPCFVSICVFLCTTNNKITRQQQQTLVSCWQLASTQRHSEPPSIPTLES